MTDSEFLDAAETLLQAVEASCDLINDETDVDLDNQRLGTMVTLTFRNGTQIIINLQKPLHEVWMAAPDGGFHFRWEKGRWTDTKGAGDFLDVLSRCAARQAGRTLTFRPH